MKNKYKVRKLYTSGVPVKEISEMLGVTREAIYQKLRGAKGWEDMKRLTSLNRSSMRFTALQERSDEIVNGWLSGKTIDQLSREFKTSRKNISNIIKGVLGTTRRRYQRDLEIVQLYRNGVTQTELAKRYHISQPCISRIVRNSQ